MMENLFRPIKIKDLTIGNRLMVSPMVTNLCTSDGMATEAYIQYHLGKAKGGWGLIVTEDYAVEERGKGYRCIPGFWNDEQLESHKALTAAVHQYESKLFAQIYHAGRQTTPRVNGGAQPVAPSAIPCPSCKVMPRELTAEEISDIVEKFAMAAERAQKAGFDGIEIHGGHGYLIAQFMSPYSNKRGDEYGGCLQNRMRFPREIIREIRKRVGDNFPISFRISADEKIEGGREIGETRVIAELLQEYGVDLLNISVGTYGTPVIAAPMHFPHGWIVEFAREVKQTVSIPVITVDRINDPLMAENLLKTGKADIIAMGRASLADPQLPNKARAGDLESIRYCLGCLTCDHSLVKDTHIRCAVNPTLSYEYEGEAKEAAKKGRVYVAGGGPAGMEAARAAASRGHEVHLFEKDASLGGQFKAASYPPYKGELATILAWEYQELKKLQVHIHCNTPLTRERIEAGKPDKVIIATGAAPFLPPIPGIERRNVAAAVDVLLGKAETGRDVVIIGGGSVGVETAMHLAMQEKNITVVELLGELAKEEDDRIKKLMGQFLREHQVEVQLNARVVEIMEHGVLVEHNHIRYFKQADTVVVAAGAKRETKLYDEIGAIGPASGIQLIGDAREERRLIDAIREGYLAGISTI